NKDGILMKKINGSDTLLKLTITTTDSEELKTIASFVKTQWEKIGIQVDIIVLDQNTLNQEAIRPRKYDVLLFGMVIGNEADLYSFWHSSQRSDPGLNISFYTSVQTDNLLAKLEDTNNKEQRRDLVRQIQNTIASDHPAVFMYSPYFIYAAPKDVQNIKIKYLTRSSDRLLQIYDWYIDTEYIWKIFK
ncbi:MAG TPA: ABC transporter substrate-binding protein, partial [Candidatus Paceibacterota bacterium]